MVLPGQSQLGQDEGLAEGRGLATSQASPRFPGCDPGEVTQDPPGVREQSALGGGPGPRTSCPDGQRWSLSPIKAGAAEAAEPPSPRAVVWSPEPARSISLGRLSAPSPFRCQVSPEGQGNGVEVARGLRKGKCVSLRTYSPAVDPGLCWLLRPRGPTNVRTKPSHACSGGQLSPRQAALEDQGPVGRGAQPRGHSGHRRENVALLGCTCGHTLNGGWEGPPPHTCRDGSPLLPKHPLHYQQPLWPPASLQPSPGTACAQRVLALVPRGHGTPNS